MDYRTMNESFFTTVFDQVRRRVEAYGIRVSFDILPWPDNAQFNGADIILDDRLAPDVRLYTLLHLFGHNVQWSTSEEMRRVGTSLKFGELNPDAEQALRGYERQATEMALWLLHEIGVTQLDQWLTDIWHWDFGYIAGVFASGVYEPQHTFDYVKIPTDQPLLTPAPVPSNFIPYRFEEGRAAN